MKGINYRFVFVVLLACFFLQAVPAHAQNIERVIQDVHYGKKMNATVIIYGVVAKWDLNRATNTIAYEIQDDWGDKITVISSRPHPETHKRYVISGYVAYDQANSAYQIMETSQMVIEPPIMPPPDSWWVKLWKSLTNTYQTVFIILISVIVVLALAILIYMLLRSRSRVTVSDFGSDAVVQVTDPTQKMTIAQPTQEAIDLGTIKLMPGRFEVAGGVDIKEIRLIRPKSVEESDAQYTFGRKTGDPIMHIQLNDITVSAEQAILRIEKGQYTLTNRSKVNATTVNNQPLAVYESRQLSDGDVITMGRVTMTYRSK
jgi:hypothetical protein